MIVQNKKAHHDYSIEERYEAGLVLEGWEVKAIRAGQVQLGESYVIVRNGELFLLNGHITPLKTASTHINPEPTRTRKLLLKAAEIRKLIGKVERRPLHSQHGQTPEAVKPVFVDTFFLLAALNPDDAYHEAALAWSDAYQGPLLTTAWVITEVADALAGLSHRRVFREFYETLTSETRLRILAPDHDRWERGLRLYFRWSAWHPPGIT